MMAHAPHCPSAHPSLTLVKPSAGRKFRAVVCAPARVTSTSRPLILITARFLAMAESVMASSLALTGYIALLWADAWLRASEARSHAQVIHAEQNAADVKILNHES